MKRLLVLLSIIVAIATLLGAAGCGASSQSAGLAGDQSPAGILASAMDAASSISRVQADFDLTMSFAVDRGKAPDEAVKFLDQPMKVSGHATAASDPRALDLTVDSTMAGQEQKFALKMVADNLYVGLADHWYKTPAELSQMLGGSGSAPNRQEDVREIFAQSGLDPSTWMTNVRAVGNETVGGVSVHHLQATPDVNKIMADLVKLLQNREFSRLMGQATPGATDSGTNQAASALQGLEGMQQQLAQMFRTLTLDLWVDTDRLYPVKLSLNAEVQPPAGQDSGGIDSIKIALNILLTHINEAVQVDPPVAPEPWEALQKALTDDPSLLGPLGALSGAGIGTNDGTTH